MLDCPPGILRPANADTELSSAQVADAMDVPPRTARHWLRLWHQQGVEGIRLVDGGGRGRGGRVYVAEPSVIDRWKRGQLPEPRQT
jgi:predicted ArsR family transcriptional regulator